MRTAITIRFPAYVDLRAPMFQGGEVGSKPTCAGFDSLGARHLTDEQWETRWREGVARRVAIKRLIRPTPMFLRKQA